MDVTLPADRHGISEPSGSRFHSGDYVAFPLPFGLTRLEVPQRFRRQYGAGPGAEVLGGKLAAGDFVKVIVHGGRVDEMGRPLFVHELKQLVARQVVATTDDAHQPRIVHVDFVMNAALAAKLKMRRGAFDLYMLVEERGQSEGVVRLGIFLIADADKRCFQKAYHVGQHFDAPQTWQRQVRVDPGAYDGQGAGKVDHAMIFGFVADGPPTRVI